MDEFFDHTGKDLQRKEDDRPSAFILVPLDAAPEFEHCDMDIYCFALFNKYGPGGNMELSEQCS